MRNLFGPRVVFNICTYNRVGELHGLLHDIFQQSYSNWDLVIVDDSTDPSFNQKYIQDILNRMQFNGHKVTYHHNKYRLGIGKARNQAAELTLLNEGEVDVLIARVDDDSTLQPDWLRHLVFWFGNPEIGAVGGIVPQLGQPDVFKHTDNLPTDPANQPIFNKVLISEDNIELADDGGYTWEGSTIIKSHHLRSSFLFRKSAWTKVKGFPVEYGYSGFREETDFCLRLIMNGYKLLTNTRAINYHSLCLSGGCRDSDAAQKINMCDQQFKRKFLRYFRQGKLTKEMLG